VSTPTDHIAGKACPVQFDHNSLSHSQGKPVEIYRALRASAPVAWSESNGGYWIVTGYAEVVEASAHPEIFSSALTYDSEGKPHGGIFIPSDKGLVPMIPTEVDPPLWRDYRNIFTTHFSPKAVDSMRPMIMELTTKHIDEIIESGKCDMVLDIAAPIPAKGILLLLGLDLDEWADYGEPYHDALGYPPGSEKFEKALAGLREIVDRIRRLIKRRREAPKDDLLGAILSAQVNGQRISDEGATSVIYSAFSGGVDTTTSFLGNAFAHLSRNPDARKYLMEDFSRIRLATEELLRCSTPVQGLGRTVLKQTTLGGRTLEVGDRVFLVWGSANRDEKVFSRADACELDRYPNKHVTFGNGIHRCVGAHFARAQIEIILRQVLDRMPDFQIDEQRSRQYPNIGVVNGWVQMPASFTAGRRLATGGK
jgi:cytochrome P450